MSEQDPPQDELTGKPRRVAFTFALLLALIAVAIAAIVIVRLQAARSDEHAGPRATGQPAAPAKSADSAKPSKPTLPKPESKGGKPLPDLVPGNPLDDDRFAQLSAQVVIAAVGLKRDANWETNVLLYMQKTLQKSGVSIEQYNEYARALQGQPDRARAVAENIMMRVEKKLGYRVTMDKLPMFKFDEKTIKQLERKMTD